MKLPDGIEWCTYEDFEGACVEFGDPDGFRVTCRCRQWRVARAMLEA
jgi:hypothetical protein